MRSVERWRRAWREGGMEALCARRIRRTPRPSQTPSSPCSRKNSARGRPHTASKTNAGP
ncbi:hypothetical protein ACFV4X_36915 [Streptomyces ardesiacus]|uniref:hypothetical protein n=1 Tax=Streptomyces ardesiacus TaxID=285564 RepID=UPI00365EB736